VTAATGTWIAKADNDLDAVRRALIADPGTNNEVAAYHLQQAVEKLLKALLVHEGVAYPRGSAGHDLQVCADRLPIDHPLFAAAQALAPLTPWAIAYRYPDDDPMTASPVPSVAEIETALGAVRAFRSALTVLVGQEPTRA
jgi:HEPN domain-containing protein